MAIDVKYGNARKVLLKIKAKQKTGDRLIVATLVPNESATIAPNN